MGITDLDSYAVDTTVRLMPDFFVCESARTIRTGSIGEIQMLALLLWLGCGEKEPTNPLILDADGDGYKSDVDCDDNDAVASSQRPSLRWSRQRL